MMRRWGIEIAATANGGYGPGEYEEVDAATVTEAWVKANRRWYVGTGHQVMVVFALTGEYVQATRLDYSPVTGQGDPH